MRENTGRSTIETHTEYVRERVRCPGCGVLIATDADEPPGLCVRCGGST